MRALLTTFFALICAVSLVRKYPACLLLIAAFLSGCTSFNCTRLETLLGKDTDLISFSYSIADNLTARATPPLVPHRPDMPILVTTLVDNNDLRQTSGFGRLIQEQIASRLVQLGYTVREIKLSDSLHIKPQSGETMLTRDLDRLNTAQPAQAILVGTVSRSNRLLYLSVRFINPIDGNILATDDYKLCMDDQILAMFGLRRPGSDNSVIEEPSPPFLNSVL
ncbi:MAG: FlgO family outer membrane protein [Desulforhopalus sp.]